MKTQEHYIPRVIKRRIHETDGALSMYATLSDVPLPFLRPANTFLDELVMVLEQDLRALLANTSEVTLTYGSLEFACLRDRLIKTIGRVKEVYILSDSDSDSDSAASQYADTFLTNLKTLLTRTEHDITRYSALMQLDSNSTVEDLSVIEEAHKYLLSSSKRLEYALQAVRYKLSRAHKAKYALELTCYERGFSNALEKLTALCEQYKSVFV